MEGFFVLLVLAGTVVYVLPAVVAFARGHTWAWPITALNLLLGWSLLGWVAALVWAASPFERRPEAASAPAPEMATAPCTACGEAIGTTWLKCPRCGARLGRDWADERPVVHLAEFDGGRSA
jgi:hypothetical protein